VLAVSLEDWELGNTRSHEKPFLPATVLGKLKTARVFDRGDRLLQVAMNLRTMPSERAIRLSLTPNSASSHHHALGGRPKTTKGNGGLSCV